MDLQKRHKRMEAPAKNKEERIVIVTIIGVILLFAVIITLIILCHYRYHYSIFGVILSECYYDCRLL